MAKLGAKTALLADIKSVEFLDLEIVYLARELKYFVLYGFYCDILAAVLGYALDNIVAVLENSCMTSSVLQPTAAIARFACAASGLSTETQVGVPSIPDRASIEREMARFDEAGMA